MNGDRISTGEFRITPEKLAELQKLTPAQSPSPRKSKRKIEFYKFTVAVVGALVRANNYGPAWALVAATLDAYLDDYKHRNPVKLTSARLAKFGVTRGQKLRALKILADWFVSSGTSL
jgi:hypothetical protein